MHLYRGLTSSEGDTPVIENDRQDTESCTDVQDGNAVDRTCTISHRHADRQQQRSADRYGIVCKVYEQLITSLLTTKYRLTEIMCLLYVLIAD